MPPLIVLPKWIAESVISFIVTEICIFVFSIPVDGPRAVALRKLVFICLLALLFIDHVFRRVAMRRLSVAIHKKDASAVAKALGGVHTRETRRMLFNAMCFSEADEHRFECNLSCGTRTVRSDDLLTEEVTHHIVLDPESHTCAPLISVCVVRRDFQACCILSKIANLVKDENDRGFAAEAAFLLKLDTHWDASLDQFRKVPVEPFIITHADPVFRAIDCVFGSVIQTKEVVDKATVEGYVGMARDYRRRVCARMDQVAILLDIRKIIADYVTTITEDEMRVCVLRTRAFNEAWNGGRDDESAVRAANDAEVVYNTFRRNGQTNECKY